jgi:hypothetical protein
MNSWRAACFPHRWSAPLPRRAAGSGRTITRATAGTVNAAPRIFRPWHFRCPGSRSPSGSLYECSIFVPMGFAHQQLRDKALHALEEVVQEARYRRPRRSLALRFALAYLWAYSGTRRDPFDELWRALGQHKTPWSYSACDRAMSQICQALGIDRDDETAQRLWQSRAEEERGVPSCPQSGAELPCSSQPETSEHSNGGRPR